MLRQHFLNMECLYLIFSVVTICGQLEASQALGPHANAWSLRATSVSIATALRPNTPRGNNVWTAEQKTLKRIRVLEFLEFSRYQKGIHSVFVKGIYCHWWWTKDRLNQCPSFLCTNQEKGCVATARTHLQYTVSNCSTFPGMVGCRSRHTASPGNPEIPPDRPVTERGRQTTSLSQWRTGYKHRDNTSSSFRLASGCDHASDAKEKRMCSSLEGTLFGCGGGQRQGISRKCAISLCCFGMVYLTWTLFQWQTEGGDVKGDWACLKPNYMLPPDT